MQQPPWMSEAWSELGLTETPGAASTPRVVALFREAGHPEITSDATAWCAAFAGACLARSGLAPSGSLMARSYLRWGHAIDTPRLGAVAVLTRGGDPSAGHVGFWVGESGEHILLLGGNQSNAVTVAAFAKSRLIGFRWTGSGVASPAAARPSAPQTIGSDPLFDRCLAHVLDMEGGYSDDPYDPGGPTNKGITLAVFARHLGVALGDRNRDELNARLIAIDAASVRAIYLRRYWQPSRADEMPPPVALMHFDASVNHGVIGAAKLLQATLGVEADGEIGPITMAALGNADPDHLAAAYAEARRARYRALPHFWRFGAGWLNRVAATMRMAAVLPSPARPKKGTTMTTPAADPNAPVTDTIAPKWWGESLTMWGAAITALSTVLPVLGPLLGLDLTPDLVRKLGDQTLAVSQAIGGLVGTLMTVVGRFRATAPLSRRSMTIQL